MKKAALIIAHPDDEVLFFTGPLQKFHQDLHVVLVTDGNADSKGPEREREFLQIMKEFNIESYETYRLPDKYDQLLNQELLSEKLRETQSNYLIDHPTIFTHGPFGEYGHPHHIQISYMVHSIFLSQAENIYHPNILDIEEEAGLTFDNTWKKKLSLLETIYKNEYSRFVTLLAPKRVEKHLLSNESTLEISEFLIDPNKKPPIHWGQYKEFKNSLLIFKEHGLARKF